MTTHDAAPQVNFAGIQALLSREPGYSVAAKCLEVQAEAEASDPSLRTQTSVKLSPDAWSWYVGALGEIEVGAILASLGPDWFVRHSVPIGKGRTDVDHLVIGPSGVYIINTKRHVDASVWVGDRVLRVNNGNTSHLGAAGSQARDVAQRLGHQVGFPVSVGSLIVIVGENSIKDIRSPGNRPTDVVSSEDLLQWLRTQPRTASTGQLGLIRLAAEDPGTWHIDPAAADTLRVMSRFARLRSQVGENPPSPTAVAAAEEAAVLAASAEYRRAAASRRARNGGRIGSSAPRRTTSASKRRAKAREEALAKLIACGVLATVAYFVLQAYSHSH